MRLRWSCRVMKMEQNQLNVLKLFYCENKLINQFGTKISVNLIVEKDICHAPKMLSGRKMKKICQPTFKQNAETTCIAD